MLGSQVAAGCAEGGAGLRWPGDIVPDHRRLSARYRAPPTRRVDNAAMAETASHREKIAGRINSGLGSLTEQASFKDLLTSSTPAEGDLVLVNNSFIYRDTVKTTKSPKYIAGRLSKDGAVSSWGVVAWDHPLNVDFKHLSKRSGNLPAIVDLDDAVNDELPTVGSVVFSLLGSVGERPPTEVSLSSNFEVLRYDSTAVDQVAR